MQVKVLFDKEALNKNLHTGWGLSFLIERRILFDTGENVKWLISNMEQLGLEISQLEAAVISHDHWDQFTPLEKATHFSCLSADRNRWWNIPYKADGGLKLPSAHTVRERSSLTGFTWNFIFTCLCAEIIYNNLRNRYWKLKL